MTTLKCCPDNDMSAAFFVSSPGTRLGLTWRAGRREAATESEDTRHSHLDPHEPSPRGISSLLHHPFLGFCPIFFFWSHLAECGILVPWQGLHLCPLHCKQSLNYWTTRDVPTLVTLKEGPPWNLREKADSPLWGEFREYSQHRGTGWLLAPGSELGWHRL